VNGLWAPNGVCMWYVSSLKGAICSEQSVQSLSFFVEIRTEWAEYVEKDLCDFKVGPKSFVHIRIQN